LSGCIATDATVEEVKKNMQEANELHIRGLHEENLPFPMPSLLLNMWRFD
jgi:predicted RNase H-like HicB family nuclease